MNNNTQENYVHYSKCVIQPDNRICICDEVEAELKAKEADINIEYALGN